MDTANRLPKKLNLGCGHDYRDGWHNVDISRDVGADEYHDLADTPWPWPDETFTIIKARHVLEHLPQIPWKEIHRVLKAGGELHITNPLGHTRDEDVTHKQRWNLNTPSFIAGETAHDHEIPGEWELVNHDYEYHISNAEPLVTLYVKYRLAVAGSGPWLESIPGVYGEWWATLRKKA